MRCIIMIDNGILNTCYKYAIQEYILYLQLATSIISMYTFLYLMNVDNVDNVVNVHDVDNLSGSLVCLNYRLDIT